MNMKDYRKEGRDALEKYSRCIHYHNNTLTEDSYVAGYDDGARKKVSEVVEKTCRWICGECDMCDATDVQMATCPKLMSYRRTMEEE